MEKTLKDNGTLIYEPVRVIERKGKTVVGHKRTDSPWWLVLNVSESISAYYRWWMEKELNPLKLDKGFKLNSALWQNHITVLSGREEINENFQQYWKKYNNEIIEFEYLPYVYQTWRFFCIPVKCKKLEDIRKELGLTSFIQRESSVFPDYHFHLTIGRLL